jgi:predicted nucleotidyltransferase
MIRLDGFESVRFTDAYGGEMNPESIEERFGRDGGIDCVIHIITQTERGAKNVATRIRNIIVSGDY